MADEQETSLGYEDISIKRRERAEADKKDGTGMKNARSGKAFKEAVKRQRGYLSKQKGEEQ